MNLFFYNYRLVYYPRQVFGRGIRREKRRMSGGSIVTQRQKRIIEGKKRHTTTEGETL